MNEGDRIVIAGGQPPWLDIVFTVPVCEVHEYPEEKKALSLEFQTDHAGVKIGIALDILLHDWEFEQSEELSLFWGDMRLRPIGEKTDDFISVLESAYGLDSKRGKLTAPLFCECVSFEVDPVLIEKVPICGKLFLGSPDQPVDHNAQLFVTIDLPNKRGWFTVKDEIYSPRIIKWLRGEYTVINHENA